MELSGIPVVERTVGVGPDNGVTVEILIDVDGNVLRVSSVLLATGVLAVLSIQARTVLLGCSCVGITEKIGTDVSLSSSLLLLSRRTFSF